MTTILTEDLSSHTSRVSLKALPSTRCGWIVLSVSVPGNRCQGASSEYKRSLEGVNRQGWSLSLDADLTSEQSEQGGG